MKLWQKTSLICIAVLLVIVAACSAVLLLHSKNSILELTYSHAESKQRSLAYSFSEMAVYYLADGDSMEVETSLVNYCFSRLADASSVLMRGEETPVPAFRLTHAHCCRCLKANTAPSLRSGRSRGAMCSLWEALSW